MDNKIRFGEINDFFETTGFELKTDIPDFFIFSLNDVPKSGIMSMRPYQKDFYHITLALIAKKSKITINEQQNTSNKNFLYFLSPDHMFSWQRDIGIMGLTIFFKPSFLNFYNGSFYSDFSFFDLADKNIIELSPSKIKDVLADFEKIHKEFNSSNPYRIQRLQTLILTLLYKFKGIQEEFTTEKIAPDKKQTLVYRFKNLVNNLYIKLKQVGEYAEKLFVTPNTLNKTVKELTGKTAKDIITDKILLESKKMLLYTSSDISEIAYNLGYEEPTHFIRFFKNHTKQTPKEYRLHKM